MSQPRVIVHIDMDAFFASVEQRDNPALKGKPVIVGADPKQGAGRGVVATCSYEARKFGIHSAMPISIAYRKCPQGIFLRGNMRTYKKVSEQIFDILYDFTPDMEPVSIDEAFLDITGSYHFYQTPYKTCVAIKRRIQDQLGLTASLGIAPTKMAAKIASDLSKPDGLLEVPADKLLEFLWPLPVERLWGVGAQTQKMLNTLGIKSIGDLARAPLKILSGRFGVHGEGMRALANGVDDREVHLDEDVKSVSHEHTFDIDESQVEQMDKVLSFLSEKVSRRLRKEGLKGKTVTVKIRLSNFRTVTRARTFSEPVNYFEDIDRQAKELFHAFYRPLMKIRLLGVRVSNFEEGCAQESLFPDPMARKKERVHEAIDRIKDKFGEKAIHRAINL